MALSRALNQLNTPLK